MCKSDALITGCSAYNRCTSHNRGALMRLAPIAAALLFVPAAVAAQYHQTDFPAEEFRARHAQVFAKIGDNAVAVVQGVHQTEGFTLPRQHNTFYYLSGIETPG